MHELNEWFLKNRRDLPWRNNPTPYKVWVSEVMLQQTRASVVIPYFEKWLLLFPDVKSLAAAPLDQVIKCWEGLGYYSRARNLHAGAKQVVNQFGGIVPSEKKDLESIKGLGPYTVGAILSFGFNKRAPAVDGNVLRVISRYYCIEENVSKSGVRKKIEMLSEQLLDEEKPWVTVEGLIELGATLCQRKPKCEECPLKKGCIGLSLGKAESLPIKSEPHETVHLKRVVIWIEAEGKVLVKKGMLGEIMADLYEFPYFEMGERIWSEKMIISRVREVFGFEIQIVERLEETVQSFTKYRAHLYPLRAKSHRAHFIEGHQWVLKNDLSKLPFSSGHRRIINS